MSQETTTPPSSGWDYVEALGRAKAFVRRSSLWARFIDHTPLSNDIAVWMADFASQEIDAARAADASQIADLTQWNDTARGTLEHLGRTLDALGVSHRIDWREWIDQIPVHVSALSAQVGQLTKDYDVVRTEVESLTKALRGVRAHTGYLPGAPYTLLAGLLASVERITDAALSTPPQTEAQPHHMKRGGGTVCGAQIERGNSYYEWAYVNCPDCLSQRPSAATPSQTETKSS